MSEFNYGRLFREIEKNMRDEAMERWYPGGRAPTPTLTEAWRAAVEALPSGWVLEKVYRRDAHWSAWARNTNPPIGPGVPGLRGDSERDSDNPAEALADLTRHLIEYSGRHK